MSTVLVAVAAFTLVMLVLVGLLTGARALLAPSGPVRVAVNGGGPHDVLAETGGTLLSALAGAGIFLPSACGGRGTCGACRVRVESGAPSLLPTESVHIDRGEALRGWRLACQLKLRQEVAIALPREVFEVGRWRCTVRSARNVATFIREIEMDLPAGEEIDFRAGSYIQVECPPHDLRFADFEIAEEYRDEWDRFDLWRLESRSDHPAVRAYSLANPPKERSTLMLNVRIATPPAGSSGIPPGVVSSYLFGLEPGDEVVVTGPFGDFLAPEGSHAEMVFVGGGAGMAPMRSHILDQLERIRDDRRIGFWYGARSVRESFYVDLFTRLDAAHDNFSWHLALSDPAPEDYWDGDTGFIHQVLYAAYLRDHPAPEDIEYYLCGPPVMIAACLKMLDELGVDPDNVRYDDFGV